MMSILVAVVAVAAVADDGSRYEDRWSGRVSRPAVVNPAVKTDDGSVLSLRGEWDFAPFRHGLEVRDIGYQNDLRLFDKPGIYSGKVTAMRKIRVPGCWQAQGVGEAGPGRPNGKPAKADSTMMRNTHWGNGYYRREVTPPAEWKGRRIWLKGGLFKNWAWIWINGRGVAHVTEQHRALKWDVTDLVVPGEPFDLRIQVDNTYPTRNSGQCGKDHWGGIVRDLELEATPMEAWIDDAWVRGDFDRRQAQVKVEVGGQRSEVGGLRLEVEDETVEVPVSSSTSTYDLHLALRAFRPWSPEHPNLYTARVELVSLDGKVLQTRFERFGVKKFEVRGKELYLNGRPFFVRGFGDDSVYPIEGISPADREFHLNHLLKARAAGFNYARLHTHFEMPEYFEAADEAGIMVQPELSYNCDESSEESFTFDPVGDMKNAWIGYRRYVSWATVSGGNEGTLGPNGATAVKEYLRSVDSGDHPFIEQDGGTYFRRAEGYGVSDFLSGPMSMWERGSFDDGAFVCHEYANLAVKADARSEAKYTGAYLPPMTRAMRRKNLAAAGLSDEWGDRLQDAQHDLQRFWGLRSIEHARKDPFCDGFIYWTIADYGHAELDSNTVNCQGMFDQFWDDRPHGLDVASVRRVNSAVALSLDTENRERVYVSEKDPMLFCGSLRCLVVDETNRVFTAGETIPAEFILQNYGETAIAGAKLAWKLEGERATVLAEGSVEVGDQTIGPARRIAKFPITVPAVVKPVKATLTASVLTADGKTVKSNYWFFYLFPKTEKVEVPDGWAVVKYGSDEVEAARKAGRNLVIVGSTERYRDARDLMLGWWALHWREKHQDFDGMAVKNSPVLGDLPYEPYLTPMLWRIAGKGTVLPLKDGSFTEKDYVIVSEHNRDFRLNLAARTRADGGREVFVSGLDVFADLPEARTLLRGIFDTRPRIVAFGDSITQGKIGIRPEENWLRLLQKRLGDGYRTFNAGVGGNSAREAMARFDRDVLARDPDIVLIEFGGNNHDSWNAARRVGDEEFRRHLRTFRDGLPKRCRVIAVTFPPLKEDLHRKYQGVKEGDPRYCGDKGLDSQRQILRDFAAENGWGLVDLHAIMKERHAEYVLNDGVHLNSVGQKVFAEAAEKAIRSIRFPFR